MVNFVGNVVMWYFKYYIIERLYWWFKEDNLFEEEDIDWLMNFVIISMEFLKNVVEFLILKCI